MEEIKQWEGTPALTQSCKWPALAASAGREGGREGGSGGPTPSAADPRRTGDCPLRDAFLMAVTGGNCH